ncbi:GIY-YIG nuclease family protein [Thalassococcus lentus]|uniref:GIY-YIG nuclease family protein n=1 Tax=Thalassococcus lentus TaxID=1210524 RepID=A0ABT4XRN7_9RHOB|nr:GIY-YIG nuclease family protein [Thalassococcus lentus]MDA7424565.1 GIY-YIG nuclease family protein [Thalassococcus lentus]
MITGRSLELFFVDGRPDGMLTAEVFNWTGHVLRLPKTQLADGLKRREAKQTGVYLLLGENDFGELAYIGEAENMAERLRQHLSQKEWWNDAILITTAGDALHKAHVKYLESRLVEIAKDAQICPLENGNIPSRPSLNEAATANMESFLSTLQMVLPAIRVDLFQSKKRPSPSHSISEATSRVELELRLAKRGLRATAFLENGEVIVESGSQLVSRWVGKSKYHEHVQLKHAHLLNSDIVEVGPELSVFKENYAFSSLSTAAATILGRSSNGRTEWKLREDGRTYAEWEEDALSKLDTNE